ncbi:serine hydrolase [uncultured Thiohalocapsa sp.]|uniref:serine hydrolase domain-containing protein n=1 Tax=uncultured Thiohalocapsa sp. TaxID=768990 RepID=UPI0025D16453|nr:serine hydrolase domain-containing protein [uncultured Thiohalocapsa sp.]
MPPSRLARSAALCLGLAVVIGAGQARAARDCDFGAAEQAMAERTEARVQAALPELIRQHEVPGAAVALVANGHLRWTAGYGWAVPDKRIPFSPDTVFQAGSMTLPITAWTLLTLVDQGRIDLDSPVEPYLKGRDLPESPYDVAAVTPRRVLSHTAGLSIPRYGGFGPDQTLQTLNQSLRGALDAGNQPVAIMAPPGVGFAYSAGGYALAELMVRQMANEQFANVAERRILRRLHMFRSSLPDRPDPAPPLAVTYDDAGEPAPARSFSALGAAGLQTTAADYARFVAALLPGPCGEPLGRGVLKPKWVEQSRTAQPDTDNALLFAGSEYGLGMALKTLPDSGNTLVYHPGDNPPNWHGLFAAVPAHQSGLVVLTSAAGGRDLGVALLCTWLDALGEMPPAECAGGGQQPVPGDGIAEAPAPDARPAQR